MPEIIGTVNIGFEGRVGIIPPGGDYSEFAMFMNQFNGKLVKITAEEIDVEKAPVKR